MQQYLQQQFRAQQIYRRLILDRGWLVRVTLLQKGQQLFMDEHQDYRIIQDLATLLDHADRLVLRPFNLSTIQYNALLLLNTEEGWRLTDLSDRLLCERSTVTRLIDYLESEGLISRCADPADRRSQRVTLTAAGLARRDQAQAAN